MSRGFCTSGEYLFLEKLSESRGVVFPSPTANDKSAAEARSGLWFGRTAQAERKLEPWHSEYKAQFDGSAKKQAHIQQIVSVPPVYRLKRFK
eukprot:7553987-Pyramimonas_sp.AAC.1